MCSLLLAQSLCTILLQLKKVYKDDMAGLEANEDMARMREYAMGEVDLLSVQCLVNSNHFVYRLTRTVMA